MLLLYNMRPALTIVLVSLGVLSASSGRLPAAAELSAGQVTAVAGQGVVFHASAPQGLPLKVPDPVFLEDRIETRERSAVRVLLGGKATVTVRELSTLLITEDPHRATVELPAGKIALQVNKALMKPGDMVRVQTPNAIVAVRGSLVVIEVTGAPDAPQSRVTALEASLPILVAPRSDPSQTIPLLPSQTVTVRGTRYTAWVGAVRGISKARARRDAEAAEMPSQRWDAAEGRSAEGRAKPDKPERIERVERPERPGR